MMIIFLENGHKNEINSFQSLAHNSHVSCRLSEIGERVGIRMLELLVFRESSLKGKRETKVIGVLNFIHSIVWKVCLHATS